MTRASIKDLLSISPRFLRSVNLERDFGDSSALDGYVSTAETLRHLQRIGKGLRPESGERAWRITGDFGSGKSSFALVLANLLSRPSKELPENIRKLRGEIGLRSNAPKLLPVLVTGAREVLSFAVLRSVLAALNRSIDTRKKLKSREKLKAVIDKGKVSDRDALALIEETAAELVSKDHFGGILIIIDELGKALEFAALHPEQQDVYFLQTLAESSSRSGSVPVYTLGLLHQGFAEYAEKLPSTAQLEWAKVSERFSEIAFAQPLGQVATLISAALALNTNHAAIYGWKGRAKDAMGAAINLGMYGSMASKSHLSEIATSLYPLHPTVIPVLARFFRRFGQNERSLFSFLLSSEPYALPDFATREAGPEVVYRLSDFYDFAANNFAHRLSSQSFRSHWNQIDARIRSAGNESPEIQKLLKTVGILNVLHSAELHPTEELLALALGDGLNLAKELVELCKRGILFNRGKAGYSLWPHASVNLEQRIEEAREKLTHASPIAEVVREKLDSRPIVARRHYIRTGNLRHFDVRFVTASEYSRSGTDLAPIHPADGVVAVVLCESVAERQKAEKEAMAWTAFSERLVAISAPLDTLSPAALELERWEWLERNTPELKDDRFAAEEVSRQIDASRQLLESRLREFVGFRDEATASNGTGITWFHEGKRVQVIGQEQSLQFFLSELCDHLFAHAPEVRNELVNRHLISSAAASARQKLFKAMLENARYARLGMQEDKAPPEKSMYLSLLEAGGIHYEKGDEWRIGFPNETADSLHLRPALNAIMEKLEEVPDRRVPVGELYSCLRAKPYGVRDGLIPILLLVVFIAHETEIAIYEDNAFQPEIEEFLMMRLAKRPETFEFQLCRIAGVRKALISELAAVVGAERVEGSRILSIVRPIYSFLGALPDYVHNTDQLAPETLALRKAIGSAREPNELVFKLIPKAFGFDAKAKLDAGILAKKLGKSITELRRCFPELQARMASAIVESFKFEGSLEDWRQSIAGSAETILVGLGDPEFRAFCMKLVDTENAEAEWLEALGSLLTRCPPSRWKDRDELVFRERTLAFAAQFNRVLATCFLRDGTLPDSAIRLAVTPRSGVERNLVISLTPDQSRETEKVLSELRKHLSTNSQISLAALSRLLWDTLPIEE